MYAQTDLYFLTVDGVYAEIPCLRGYCLTSETAWGDLPVKTLLVYSGDEKMLKIVQSSSGKVWQRVKGWLRKASRFIKGKVFPVVKQVGTIATVLPVPPQLKVVANAVSAGVTAIETAVNLTSYSNSQTLTASVSVDQTPIYGILQYHICALDSNDEPVVVDPLDRVPPWQDVGEERQMGVISSGSAVMNQYGYSFPIHPRANGIFHDRIQWLESTGKPVYMQTRLKLHVVKENVPPGYKAVIAIGSDLGVQ